MIEIYILLVLGAAAFALAVYLVRSDRRDGGIPPWNQAGRGSSITRSEQEEWRDQIKGAWHPDAQNEDGTLKRDIHHNVLHCVRCGKLLEEPCSTMTRDEWYCLTCKLDNAVADAHD